MSVDASRTDVGLRLQLPGKWEAEQISVRSVGDLPHP